MTDNSQKSEQTVALLPIKKYITYVLVGGLVVSSLIAIIAVLAGGFTDTVGRAFATTITIVIHSLIGLTFLSAKRSRSISSTLIINTLFTIVVASMATSVLGIWEVLNGQMVANFYATFLVVLFAVLIIAGLLTTHLRDKLVRTMALSASGGVALAFALLVPWIFADDYYTLPEFYFRVIAASFILAATLTVLTIIFERMYAVKHPEPAEASNPHAMPFGVKLLLIFLVLFFGGWMIFPLFFGLIFGAAYN